MNPWDQRFSSEDYLFGTEPAAALVKLEPRLIAGGQTLVVADGEGRNSTFLAGQGYGVQATDYSEVGLAKARKLATRMGVSVDYQLQNIFDVDWTAQRFDNVVAVFIQFVPPDAMRSVLSGLASALRPGGVLLLHGYTPEQVDLGTGGPPQREHMYTAGLLREVYQDFSIEVCEEYRAEISEGRGHRGVSALIDFVGRKAE